MLSHAPMPLHIGLLQPRLPSWLLGLASSSSSFKFLPNHNFLPRRIIHTLLHALIALRRSSAGAFATLHCDLFTTSKDRGCALFLSEFPVPDIELMHKLH